MDKKEIANIILYHRKKSGFSRNELAEYAQVGKTAIYDLEKGDKNFRIDTLLNVCDILNIKLDFRGPLLGDYEKSKD